MEWGRGQCMTLQDYFVQNAQLKKEWASDRNAEKPEGLRANSHAKVWWRCEKGHEWKSAVYARVTIGRNCPYCVNQAIIPGENDMETVAPEMARLWHLTLNGTLSPSDLFSGSRKQVWWQCEKGHAWKAPAYSIKAGRSCPYCSGRNAILGETDLATTHPQVIPMWSERNKILPTEVTANSHRKVLWLCEKGHQWETAVAVVAVEGCGCPYCAGKLAIPGETDLATVNPDILAEWDYEKNTLNPSEILPSTHEKVWWKCALGHSWQAAVFSRTREKHTGCPYCAGRKVLAGFNDLATLKPTVAKEWHPTLNGELRPEDVTLGSNRRVWWRCRESHVWQAAIYSRTRKKGAGCPVCAGTVKIKDTKRAKPRKAAQSSLRV